DRITVLRRGRVIGTVQAAAARPPMLAEMMVGRPVLMHVPRSPAMPGAARLEVAGLSVSGAGGRLRVREVSFSVRAGEIYAFPGGPLLDDRAVDRFAAECCREYDIRVAGPGTPALALSGGNQQRLVIAREFAFTPTILIAAQPTRGLDVGATEFVYRRLHQIKDRGLAVLLVSVDLEEALALADRIAVLYNGRIAGEFRRGEADAATLGLYMAGGGPQAGRAVP